MMQPLITTHRVCARMCIQRVCVCVCVCVCMMDVLGMWVVTILVHNYYRIYHDCHNHCVHTD